MSDTMSDLGMICFLSLFLNPFSTFDSDVNERWAGIKVRAYPRHLNCNVRKCIWCAHKNVLSCTEL
jgi:hypothetical protein